MWPELQLGLGFLDLPTCVSYFSFPASGVVHFQSYALDLGVMFAMDPPSSSDISLSAPTGSLTKAGLCLICHIFWASDLFLKIW